jgi:hypothetical protein
VDISTRVSKLEDTLALLAAAQTRTEATMQDLAREVAQAQVRTGARFEELAQAQARTEARLEELAQAQVRTEARLEELAQAQARTAEQLGTLVMWQEGESGRREGERLERDVLRRAHVLFYGGDGGNVEQQFVRRRLTAALLPVMDGDLLPADDPSLADVLWWKGDQMAVVEVSRLVDLQDVDRAVRRAATLQRAGHRALPVVIGDTWAGGDLTRDVAKSKQLGWRVGSDVSEPYNAFRRLPPGNPPPD